MRLSDARDRRLQVGIVVVLMVLCFLGPRWSEAIAGTGHHLLRTVLSPVTVALTEFSNWVRRPADTPVAPADLAELQRNLSRLRQDYVRLNDELVQARDELRVAQRVAVAINQPRAGLVTASVSSADGRKLTINRGALSGLDRAMIVLDDRGNVIGRVLDTGPASATVGLITAPGNVLEVGFMEAKPGPKPRPWTTRTIRASADGQTFRADNLRADSVNSLAAVGDTVHLADPRWQPACGSLVGVVTQIVPQPEDPTLYRLVVIKPAVSLQHLSRVVVVVPADSDH